MNIVKMNIPYDLVDIIYKSKSNQNEPARSTGPRFNAHDPSDA